MPTVAVLPVKSFRQGKGRLADGLGEKARADLGRALAERLGGMVEEVGMLPLLVAGDAEVADWAVHLGFPFVPDPGTGLDGAAIAGTDWAMQSNNPWLVLHTDLPLLVPEELVEAEQLLQTGRPVIAPSADGGTSALGGHDRARFGYGPGSFHTHVGWSPEATILVRLGFLHDVDSPSDLDSALRHPRGSWLSAVL